MSDRANAVADETWQQAGQSRRIHPTNAFIPFPRAAVEQSIPARFEQQVSRYPDRPAVKTDGQTLTYAELNRTANRMGRAVLARRSRAAEPIALLLEHGAPMIVGILGVLKAGKIYVPLDPAYPPERTTYMLEDAQASLIVTDHRHLALARNLAQPARDVMNIDALDGHIDDDNIGLAIPPDTLAYILYTSGSTGQPKGVVQNHRNVLHNMMKYTNGAHICAEDRLSLLVSYSFSGAVTNTFSALLNGASLFPYSIKEKGLTGLADWLVQEDITLYQSVATVFRHFLDTLKGPEAFPNLRLIDLFGEAVTVRDVERYKRHFPPHCLLQHRMAATEMSVIRLYFIDKQTPMSGSVVPVGYAVDDTEVFVLDEAGDPVQPNQTGEIVIKSRYLAPGYWRRPELTQAAFLPSRDGDGERLYRTGDLGCMLPDGCLMHLGRKDFQVKIRGHRIEVGEIELALLDLAAVKEAVVLVREDAPGDKRLVAYVVPAQEPAPTVSELRSFLQTRLPDYMAPAAFVLLKALPLLPNGKVDRLALPAPGQVRPALSTPFAAPQTPLEQSLARLWAEVLGLEQVGIHDNFLELGGHSLLATRLISRVLDDFHIEVPLQTLLEAPTVTHMAVIIAQHQAARVEPGEMDRLLDELEGLSAAEVQQLLSAQED